MRFVLGIAAALLITPVSFGQSLAIGAIGGEMLTNDLSTSWVSGVSTRYAVGPELDIGLPLGLGFEVDALYRHENYQVPAFSSLVYNRNSWEFPLLVKERLGLPLVKPFVEAGYAPRTLSQGFSSGTSHGIVLGGGVELGVGRLRVAPAIRYTRWNNGPALLVFANGPTIYLTQNQVDVLVGLSWKLH